MSIHSTKLVKIVDFQVSSWGEDMEFEWFYPKDDKGFVYDKDRDRLQLVHVQITCTKIPEGAFHKCQNLKSVHMDDMVEEIEDGPFEECDALTYIKFSPNIKRIGRSAFWGCSSLHSIFIPPTCKSIEDHAFYRCGNLKILQMSPKARLGRKVVWGCKTLLMNSPFDTEYEEEEDPNINTWLLKGIESFPFHAFCASPDIRSLQLFIRLNENGKQVGLKTNFHGMTALHILMASPFVTCEDESLLSNYLRLYPSSGLISDHFNDTPLHHLVRKSFGCSMNMVVTYLHHCRMPCNIENVALACAYECSIRTTGFLENAISNIFKIRYPQFDLTGLEAITSSYLSTFSFDDEFKKK